MPGNKLVNNVQFSLLNNDDFISNKLMVTVSRSEAERFNNIPIIAVMGVQSPHIRQNGTAPGGDHAVAQHW